MIAPAHNITIEFGTTVSLNCSASVQDCSMCSVSLVWKHGNVPLSGAKFIAMDEVLSSTLLLTVNMSSQGEYSCQTNGTMTEIVKSVYITAASQFIANHLAKFFLPFTGVTINEQFKDIRIGNTVNITCMVAPLSPNTTYKWLSQKNGSVKSISNSNILTLTGNHTIDRSMITCLVNSSQLYSPIEKTITVTVQGMCHKFYVA